LMDFWATTERIELMRLFIATTVCLLIISSTIYGQQIQPNPNPSGHTITVDTSGM
jgi:hypothetical protein